MKHSELTRRAVIIRAILAAGEERDAKHRRELLAELREIRAALAAC